ncbi:MAG TPA: hypothetical protein VFJ96_01770 [Gemmatimonadaceae bacterium]|nr:hypothetical protein [Gemmatimonadaceae bacterium]
MSVACGNPSGPDAKGYLDVQAVAPNLELQNRSAAPIYTRIVDSEYAALSLWMPCTDPAKCTALQPAERREVPYIKIKGYSPSSTREVIVYWYHLVPDSTSDTGFAPDTIRSMRIVI